MAGSSSKVGLFHRIGTALGLTGCAAPIPPLPPDDSAETWAAGDLAECIGNGRWYLRGTLETQPGPVTGEIRIVDAVWIDDREPCPGVQFLRFARWNGVYHAASFRKIVPRADEARAGENVADLIQRYAGERLSS